MTGRVGFALGVAATVAAGAGLVGYAVVVAAVEVLSTRPRLIPEGPCGFAGHPTTSHVCQSGGAPLSPEAFR